MSANGATSNLLPGAPPQYSRLRSKTALKARLNAFVPGTSRTNWIALSAPISLSDDFLGSCPRLKLRRAFGAKPLPFICDRRHRAIHPWRAHVFASAVAEDFYRLG